MSRSRARACGHQHHDGMRGSIAGRAAVCGPLAVKQLDTPHFTKPLLVPAEVSHLANPSWACYFQPEHVILGSAFWDCSLSCHLCQRLGCPCLSTLGLRSSADWQATRFGKFTQGGPVQQSLPESLIRSVLPGWRPLSPYLVDAQAAQNRLPVLRVCSSALRQLLLNAGLQRLQLCMRLACRDGQWQPGSCLYSNI